MLCVRLVAGLCPSRLPVAASAIVQCSYAGWMSASFTVISASQMLSYLQLRRPCGTPVAPLSEREGADLLINIIKH